MSGQFDLLRLMELHQRHLPSSSLPTKDNKGRAVHLLAESVATATRRIAHARTAAQVEHGRSMTAFESRRVGKAMGELLVDLASLVRVLGLEASVTTSYALDALATGNEEGGPQMPTAAQLVVKAPAAAAPAISQPVDVDQGFTSSSNGHNPHDNRHHYHHHAVDLDPSRRRPVHHHHQHHPSHSHPSNSGGGEDHANGELLGFPVFEGLDDDSLNYGSGPENSFGRRKPSGGPQAAAPAGGGRLTAQSSAQALVGRQGSGFALLPPRTAASRMGSDGSPVFFKAAISVSSHDAIATHHQHHQHHHDRHDQWHGVGHHHQTTSTGTEDLLPPSVGAFTRTASQPRQAPSVPPLVISPAGGPAVHSVSSTNLQPPQRVVYVLDKPKVTQFVTHVLSLDPANYTAAEFEAFGIRWCIPGVSVVEKSTPVAASLQLESSSRSGKVLRSMSHSTPPGGGSPRGGLPSRVSSLEMVDEAGCASGGQLSRRSSIGRSHGSPDFLPLVTNGSMKIVHKNEFDEFVRAMAEALQDVTNETGVHFF